MAGPGNETVYGGPRTNIIIGGAGSDVIYGGRGQDIIVDVSGKARIRTGADHGPGRDFVYVRNGRGGDTVTCG